MSENQRTTLSELGERAAIQQLCKGLTTQKDVVVGPGDDCAVVRLQENSPSDLVFTSDPVIQGIHFDDHAAPAAVGHKLVARSLSDLAAMGAAPRWALINIESPTTTSLEWLEQLYEGAQATADRYRLSIVGGDTAKGEHLALHLFACGELPHGTARLRSGVKPGDALYVTGTLGGSLNGRHLTFEPRVHEGRWLRDHVTAMIDVSDGLASDARQMAEQSKLCLELFKERIPVSTGVRRQTKDPDDALTRALSDGEDFELCFSVPSESCNGFEADWKHQFPELKMTRIGKAVEGEPRLCLLSRDGRRTVVADSGYNHFRPI